MGFIRKKAVKLTALPLMAILVFVLSCRTNHPPIEPGEPAPADQAVINSDSVTLCWCGGDPDAELPYYDVYLGKSQDPPLKEVNILERSYQAKGLEPAATYYWKVVAQDEQGDTCCGPVWSFSTMAGDPYEPNDWFSDAYGPLEVTESYHAYISERRDADFFYIIPKVNGTVTAELCDLPADYDLFLCDNSENLLRYSQHGKLEDECLSYRIDAWSRYYVIVAPCEACDADEPYTLSFSFDTARTDNYEPNDDFSQAYGPLEMDTEYESYLWDYEDEFDFYYFVADSTGTIKVDLYSLPHDYDLYLCDQSQEPVAVSDRSGTSDESVSYQVTSSELYYVVIWMADQPDSTDSYLFKTYYTESQDSYEPNDDFSQAYGPLDFGTTYESWISTSGDVDFYFFTPSYDGWCDIYLYSLPTDYDLYVFDSYQDLMGVSDNGGNEDEWLGIYTSSSETYYIVVEPFEGYDPVDSYFLELYAYGDSLKIPRRGGLSKKTSKER